ncbi:MAG: helix-turn-helix domain-containing protein [Sinobacteraceae bacterium]|nr:helix-turn-helix domain-containing protein [Nevskiaceae bacterium]
MVKKRSWGFATHRIVQHRAGIPGIEAMTMLTDHSFPRHSHDQFGIGVMTAGAQRSWSGIGQVESGAGQLLRGFFREVGATPHVYVMQLRVRLARRHLAAGKLPADAGLLAGFSDQPHMTRAFVRQYGITPARYQAAIS